MIPRQFPMFLLFIALAVGAGTAFPAEDPGGKGWHVVFQDDFNRAALGMNWLIMRGDWRIENGRLRITRPWSSDSAIRTTLRFPENVRAEFDVRMPGPWFVRAAVRIGDQYWDGGGRMRAGRGARGGGETTGEVILAAEGVKGSPRAHLGNVQPDRWHHVKLEYEDGRHRAWIDGKLARDERVILTGRFNDFVALFAIRDAEWDNVRIYTKPYLPGFRPEPAGTPETNRRATVRAGKFLDRGRPDCGFQEAIDSLPASGGAVILPEGEFILRTTLFLREGVTLRGRGRDTILALYSPIVWSKLTAAAKAGDKVLVVDDASSFRPGWSMSLGRDPMYYLRSSDPWRAERIEGNTIHLSRPLAGKLAAKTPVGNWFPLIYASNDACIEVRDLTLNGRAGDPAPFNGGYGASTVTFFFVRNVRVVNVHVKGWKGDAFSFQGGRDNLCADCSVVDAVGHGYHPGSCQRRTIIAHSKAERCTGDGYYFCRYNQQSVITANTFNRNQGAMIGGLAKAGDCWNAITLNEGSDNGGGIPFVHGANDVLVGNRIINSGVGTVIELFGGKYEGVLPHRYHPYAGPSRYHVIFENRFLDTRDQPLRILLDHPGAAANVVARNGFALKTPPTQGQAIAVSGSGSVADENQEIGARWEPQFLPAVPPPFPAPEFGAGSRYDPARPDCGFQRTIDEAARKGGGTVRLPAGRYLLRAPLVLRSGVTLCGEGLATTLVWMGRDAVVRGRDVESAGVRRLRIVGAGVKSEIGRIGVSVKRGKRVCLSELTIEGMNGSGVAVSASEEVLISRSRFTGCEVGCQVDRSAGALVSECHLLENRVGILASAGRVAVAGNVTWRSRRIGLHLVGLPEGWITGNVVSNTGGNGMALESCSNVVIRGNVVHNSSLSRSGGHAGILLAGGTRQCRIVANRVGDDLYDPFQTRSVVEQAGCDDNVIRYNVCCPNNWPRAGTLGSVVLSQGARTTIDRNVLYPYPPSRRE